MVDVSKLIYSNEAQFFLVCCPIFIQCFIIISSKYSAYMYSHMHTHEYAHMHLHTFIQKFIQKFKQYMLLNIYDMLMHITQNIHTCDCQNIYLLVYRFFCSTISINTNGQNIYLVMDKLFRVFVNKQDYLQK